MPHKFDVNKKARLDSLERRRLLDPDRVLSLLPLKPDQAVADIGCGTGFFSLPLAQRLPQGRLYAVDIAEEMLNALRAKLAQTPMDNVEVVHSSSDMEIPLPQHSLDGAFLAFVVHENEDRRGFMKTVKKLLKPGAWVAVLEWEKREMAEGPPLGERMARTEVTALGAELGLAKGGEVAVNDRHYLLLLRNGHAH